MKVIRNDGSKKSGKLKSKDFTLGDKYLVLGPGLFKLPKGFKGDTKAAITKMLEHHLNTENNHEQHEITKIDETMIFFEHNIYKHMLNVLYNKDKVELSINCSIGLIDSTDGDFEYYDRIE